MTVHVGRTEQRISRGSVGRDASSFLVDLREVHEVATARSLDGGCSTRERGGLGHVQDVPVSHQAAGGSLQASLGSSGFCEVRHGHGVDQRAGGRASHRARRHGVHVLDSSVQGRATVAGSISRSHAVSVPCSSAGDVSHVEDFNVAFTGLVGLVCIRQAGIQTTGAEGHGHVLGQSGHRAGVVGADQSGTIGTIGGHSTGPDVAGRQVDLEVQQVVGVGGAAEADLHCLTVHGVRVGQVQNGSVAVLGVEVRHDQSVTDTTVGESQAAVGSLQQLRSSGSSLGIRAGVRTADNGSRSHAGKAQATNHGSNAQGQNIFLHKNYLQ